MQAPLTLITALVRLVSSSTFGSSAQGCGGAGGSRGGFALLGDSNLDWGQDAPLLARWQREHPSEHLYLCYFGPAGQREYYGIPAVLLPGSIGNGPHLDTLPSDPGVLAISATALQGIYPSQRYYEFLMKHKPQEVLGGTIYLFRWPPAEAR